MFPLFFAIVLGFGAFAAARRNPAYAGRSLLRSSAFILLAVGAMIAFIIAATNLTIHQSLLVSGITMGAVVIFGTLGMIFIVRAVSTPNSAKLISTVAPGSKLAHLHRQKVHRWAKLFAALMLCFAMLSVPVPGKAKYALYAFGGMTLLAATILLPVMYIAAREFDVSLTALQQNPWVHWVYTPKQWLQWTNLQVNRRTATPPTFVLKRDWHRLLLPFAVIGGGVAFFSPGTPLEKTLYTAGTCGTLFAVALGSTLANRSTPEKMRAKLLKAPREIFLGYDGIFADGTFTTWLGVSVYLLEASIDERQPRSLLFRFEKVAPNPYGSPQILPVYQAVLIPDGSERDIARLQKELDARCPRAQIRFS